MAIADLSSMVRVRYALLDKPDFAWPHRLDLRLRMIFSENRYPPRIKSGAGFFRIMP